MGLDMYLKESAFDGTLAYWRKHPNLHGFIVQNYANGVDECQKIELTLDNVKEILQACESDNLPTTTGFFFGQSSIEDKEHTVDVFSKLVDVMSDDPNYKVYYRASW